MHCCPAELPNYGNYALHTAAFYLMQDDRNQLSGKTIFSAPGPGSFLLPHQIRAVILETVKPSKSEPSTATPVLSPVRFSQNTTLILYYILYTILILY